MISIQQISQTDNMTSSCPEVTTDDSEYTDVVKKITETVGNPKNYGLSPEEQEEEDREREEERKRKLSAQAAERKRRNEAALAEMAAQYEEWVSWEKKSQLGSYRPLETTYNPKTAAKRKNADFTVYGTWW